jgi:alanine-synthesizing transaminase
VDSLARAIGPRTRAVLVVQPNHPTGSCLAPAEIAALETLCERHGLAIVADEVFGDFAWDGAESGAAGAPPSSAPRALPSLAQDRRVPTFVLGGLSKTCGMPQMKCSWIAACGPGPARAEALRGLEWIADLFLTVGGPVQAALPELLEARHAFQARVRARVAENLALLRAAPGVALLPAEGGWVALLALPGGADDEEVALELMRRDVAAHPGYFYDLESPAALVVSVIVPPDVTAAALARIEDVLR